MLLLGVGLLQFLLRPTQQLSLGKGLKKGLNCGGSYNNDYVNFLLIKLSFMRKLGIFVCFVSIIQGFLLI